MLARTRYHIEEDKLKAHLLALFLLIPLAVILLWQDAEVQAANLSASQAAIAFYGNRPHLPYADEPITHTTATSPTTFLPIVMHILPPCSPGQSISDPVGDVPLAHVDVTALDTMLNGQTLHATFHLRDVPAGLVFNRVGVPEHYLEYYWAVGVDVDNNPQTGSQRGSYKGAEYHMMAGHWPDPPNTPTFLPIPDGVFRELWQYDPATDSWGPWDGPQPTLQVDTLLDTLTLTTEVPGISAASRILFVTFDWNPGGAWQGDRSSCEVSAGADNNPPTGSPHANLYQGVEYEQIDAE